MAPVVALLALVSLPDGLEEATRFLLAHGMVSPRGGEYREARVRARPGFFTRTDGLDLVHGWLLPRHEGEPPTLVDRRGLVYRAESVGARADLDANVAQEMGEARDEFDGFERSKRLLSAAVLLAGGRADLAERLVSAKPLEPVTGVQAAVLTTFVGSWYQQAVEAHATGHDEEAARLEAAILKEKPAYESKAALEPIPANPDLSPLGFLRTLPALARDTTRRLARPRAPLDLPSLRRLAPAEEAKALVADLDEMAVRQRSLPGRVEPTDSPLVRRLVEIGDPAIEPLLDCAQSDTRLTRSYSFGQPFDPTRYLVPVAGAARAALFEILGVPVYDARTSREVPVADLRAYWAKVRAKPPVERWFDVLADDAAGVERWREAASRLFDVDRPARWGAPRETIGREPVPSATEGLRTRTSPSLGELLARRARETVLPNPQTRDEYGFQTAQALRFALLDARWKAAKALPVLVETMGLAVRRIREGTAVAGFENVRALANAVEMRDALGDASVWAEYAGWVRTLPIDNDASAFLSPLARHPKAPGMADLARWAFRGPASRYNLVRLYGTPSGRERAESLVFTGLGLLPVKTSVAEILADRTVVGSVRIDARGRPQSSENVFFGVPRPDPDPRRPAPGTQVALRACDRLATALSNLPGAPAFRPYWTLAQRDAALASMRRFVQAYRPPAPIPSSLLR